MGKTSGRQSMALSRRTIVTRSVAIPTMYVMAESSLKSVIFGSTGKSAKYRTLLGAVSLVATPLGREFDLVCTAERE